MAKNTPPNDLLSKWIADAGIKPAHAAKMVGYDRGNFHRMLRGYGKPSIDLAQRIADASGGAVPVSAWAGFVPRKPEPRQQAEA